MTLRFSEEGDNVGAKSCANKGYCVGEDDVSLRALRSVALTMSHHVVT